MKLFKTSDREILKLSREKKTYFGQRNKDKNDSRFLTGNNTSRSQWNISENTERKPRFLYPAKTSVQNKGKIKPFQTSKS